MNQTELHSFLELLPDAALLLTEQGRVEFASEQVGIWLGHSAVGLRGLEFSSFYSGLEEGIESPSLKVGNEPQVLRLKGGDAALLLLGATVSRVEVEGTSLLLVLLRQQRDRESLGEADNLRNHLAVDTWKIGLYEHDHLTDEIYGCPKVRELYCLAESERLTIEVFAGALHPDDFDQFIDEVRAAHDPEGEGRFNVFHRIVRSDGSVRWIHTQARTTFGLVNGQMAPVLTTGSIMDMTRRQELEFELQKKEERLVMATVASGVGILEVNYTPGAPGDGKEEIYWSASLRELAGIDADFEPSFQWYFEHVHPSDLSEVQRSLAAALDPRNRQRSELDHRFFRPDGEMRWMSLRTTTIFDGEGDEALPLRLVGVVLDSTGRRAAEEDRERRTAILDATPDFVCITDPEGKITYLNRAGRRLLGLEAEEALGGRTIGRIHPPETLELINQVGLPTANRVGSWAAETVFLRHDGVAIPMSQVLLVHRDVNGEVAFHSTIARDLSHEQELEEQFRQAQKMEAVGRLAGGVAHDFNNLLSVILGFAEIACDRMEKGKSGKAELQEIQRAAQRAAALTGQLLAFSRKQILSPRAIDINEIVVSTVPMFQRLLDESIELAITPSRECLKTKADPHQVEQILLNLVVNARDAMPRGGRLSLECSEVTLDETQAASRLDLDPGTYVVLAVSDTGEGMTAEVREKIFEPFFTTKEPGKGTGLGLSTVFGIVRQSGGDIWVYSEPGLGTTFKIYFPSTKEKAAERMTLAPASGAVASGVILVTEDDAQLRRMVVSVLSRAGYTVLGAAGPVDALGLADEYQGVIDLLLTDVVMPNMSGKKLAEELFKSRPSTEVLYMSGYTEDSIVHHGVLDEGINFISKPITPRSLLAAIERLLVGRKVAQ